MLVNKYIHKKRKEN